MLTAIQARNAKPKEKSYKLTDGKGLFLHVTPAGKKNLAVPVRIATSTSKADGHQTIPKMF